MNGYWFLVSLLGACVSLALASQKGRNVPGWAALGFFFPVIAIAAIYLLKPHKPMVPTIVGHTGEGASSC